MKNTGTYTTLRNIGRAMAYYPKIAQFLGGVSNAIFLSYFIYWDGKQEDKTGWIYKRSADIQKETGLGRYEIETAKKKLKSLEIMKDKVAGSPVRTYYLFNWEIFDKLFEQFLIDIKTEEVKVKTDSKINDDVQEKNNIIGLMKDQFDKYYQLEYPIPYAWSKDKSGGKDFRALKQLKEKFRDRVVLRHKEPEQLALINVDEEIVASFAKMLEMLPSYHKKTNFTPSLLDSCFSKILMDIHNEYRKSKDSKSTNRNEQYGDVASQFAKSVDD